MNMIKIKIEMNIKNKINTMIKCMYYMEMDKNIKNKSK